MVGHIPRAATEPVCGVGAQAHGIMVPAPQYVFTQPPPYIPMQSDNEQPRQMTDITMNYESEMLSAASSGSARPHWMKSKLHGVKKVSNKERRRRQNENLRRLLTPKNALMVLNEMKPNEQVGTTFKVEVTNNAQYFKSTNQPSFCADLTIDGNNYKGYGENKLMARNAAAEQAIRDLVLKKMNSLGSDAGSTADGGAGADDEPLPMIQLASFALHKLFTEWEYEGHKVPQLKPATESEAPPTRPLPPDAARMHPAMLLTYMRPHLEYREMAVEGDRPQTMMFTIGVEIDGTTHVGKACNKKEARKQAAKAACKALYNVEFIEQPPAPKGNAAQPGAQ